MDNPIDEKTKNCLLSILQRGITEARSMALVGESEKAALLLDALDNVPRHVASWTQGSESEIRSQLRAFAQANPEHPTDYTWMLENRESIL